MFDLESVTPVTYVDPWEEPLSQRLRKLASGRQRVAYFYERADNSTFRYRIYNMAQVLNESAGAYSASYFFLDDLHRLGEIVELADLLILCRMRYERRVNHLITTFRARGKRVLFDVDDLVFDPDYTHLVCETLDQPMRENAEWDGWFAYVSRIGAALRLCDGGITTNAHLARRLRDFADLPVTVVPNFMNREQLAMSEGVFAAKRSQRPAQDGSIALGYFSGSPTHNRDFAMVVPAIATLLAEDPRLSIVVVGYMDEAPQLQTFGDRVKREPFHDFINLQRLIGTVEFNLMPLQNNTFTNCKSELKYFEAAAVGTQSIASPTYTYERAIRHGVNGYLARAHEWYGVIKAALDRLDAYTAMAVRAHDDALAKYGWFNQRQVIVAALGLDDRYPKRLPGRATTRLGSRYGYAARPDLREIHGSLQGRVSDKWSSYFDVYGQLFAPMRDAPVTLLEIGVQNGGSLDLWSLYFEQGRAFVGCDIDPRCADLRFDDARVSVVVGDACSGETQQRIAAACPAYDIVIDDGSHASKDVLDAFGRYFSLVAPGGLYCVEDSHTLYWPQFGGGRDRPDGALAFFKGLSDAVNVQHWADDVTLSQALARHFPDGAVPACVLDGWVDGVEFRNSMIVVRKALAAGHDKLGQRLVVGSDAFVSEEPIVLRDAGALRERPD
jgi:glycosyltransferase involved in cell wall biosynthesis